MRVLAMLDRHPYLPNASSSMEEMLKIVGCSSVEDLFSDVPSAGFDAGLPAGPMDEASLGRAVCKELSRNAILAGRCFTGGGPWFHHVPSVIRHIVSRGEFLTAYTPYQAEVSQGTLQALFEFQSFVCELYGMDVANASMYDLATAIGEAGLLCARVTGRRRFMVPASLPRARLAVIRNYLVPQGISLEAVPYSPEDGTVDRDAFRRQLAEGAGIAGAYIESPTFFGTLERDIGGFADAVHDAGGLAVVGADPLSLGALKSPGEMGADVAVGDGQPLGIPPGFGGNTLGIMACRGEQRIVRQMPGRIVGMTTEKGVGGGGRTGYVLALGTREQHIRRERATSNICSNETLLAISAAIYMALMGRAGLEGVSKAILSRTRYAEDRLRSAGLEPLFGGIKFRELAVKAGDPEAVNRGLARRGYSGGRRLSVDFSSLEKGLLFAFTEACSREELDGFLEALSGATGEKA